LKAGMSTGPTTQSSPQDALQETPAPEQSQPEVQSSAPLTLRPGETVGPWRILETLDWGTFGVVCRARRVDPPDSPPVALKVAREPGDPRFIRETEVLEGSNHPSIPRYVDRGLWTGPEGCKYPYFTMELVVGHGLYDWAKAQPRTHREVLQVVAQLAGALADAHARVIVHRDVKGDNIHVTSTGRAVLLDWGSCWRADGRQLTDTPAPPGTSAYRPPEQRGFIYTFRKDEQARWKVRPSDDLYALGVTLYRLVTGTYPPPCTDGNGLVEREVPRPSDSATVSPELEAIILRLLSDDRKARGTAEQLVREALALVQAGGPALEQQIVPTPSPPPSKRGQGPFSEEEEEEEETVPTWLVSAASSALGTAVAAFLVFLLMRPTPPPAPAPNPTPWLATPEEVAQFAPDAGVGDKALQSVEDVSKSVLPAILSLGRPMPKGPLRGQRTPPCERGETTINGACWVWVGGEKPPCGETMFDYDGRCYKVSADVPRQPTSGEPR